jgi:hypothetical protein
MTCKSIIHIDVGWNMLTEVELLHYLIWAMYAIPFNLEGGSNPNDHLHNAI